MGLTIYGQRVRFRSSLIGDTMIYRTLTIALVACGAAWAQVESAIITGATAPGVAKAGEAVGKGVGSILRRTGTALEAANGASAATAAPSAAATRRRGRPVRTAGAAVVNPNVSEAKSDFNSYDVTVGMTREELMAVAGKPYSKITIPIEGGSSERLTYQLKDGGSLRIVLELEKVTEIRALETAN